MTDASRSTRLQACDSTLEGFAKVGGDSHSSERKASGRRVCGKGSVNSDVRMLSILVLFFVPGFRDRRD